MVGNTPRLRKSHIFPVYSVLLQSQVYLSGTDPIMHIPPFLHGRSLKEILVRMQPLQSVFSSSPGPQSLLM